MKEAVRKATALADLFLFIVPLSFFKQVAKYTKQYCYEDWVVQQHTKQRDGETKKMPHLIQILEKLAGRPYPGKRYRADTETKKYTITTGCIICSFVILILQRGYFGTYKPPTWKLWRANPMASACFPSKCNDLGCVHFHAPVHPLL